MRSLSTLWWCAIVALFLPQPLNAGGTRLPTGACGLQLGGQFTADLRSSCFPSKAEKWPVWLRVELDIDTPDLFREAAVSYTPSVPAFLSVPSESSSSCVISQVFVAPFADNSIWGIAYTLDSGRWGGVSLSEAEKIFTQRYGPPAQSEIKEPDIIDWRRGLYYEGTDRLITTGNWQWREGAVRLRIDGVEESSTSDMLEDVPPKIIYTVYLLQYGPLMERVKERIKTIKQEEAKRALQQKKELEKAKILDLPK